MAFTSFLAWVDGERASGFHSDSKHLKPLQKGSPKGPAFVSGSECFSECREEYEEFKVRKHVGINPNPAPCSKCVPGSAEGLEYEGPWTKFSPPPAFLLFNSCLWLFSPYKGKAECFCREPGPAKPKVLLICTEMFAALW